ncbi:hypothetical protein H257_00235 [Aphanomyces astaci]|uniref:Uncharacterized protein n=1 Tax=Aphanomyces astaci TaxID=112090 RepID=W4HAX4_APHAT|nr:hypothetical protein H257_00235 [Aphanomyces astaci]ETV88716.1 hypothetical protein H257_00235 [Aphanomyces astaci]|eukprot:XP_009821116.1 hypothetical protein H257_00235 [Aphanomyces astaci]
MVPTADLQHFNLDAPLNQSTLFVVLFLFSTFGYVITACGSVTPSENAVTNAVTDSNRYSLGVLDHHHVRRTRSQDVPKRHKHGQKDEQRADVGAEMKYTAANLVQRRTTIT